MNITCIQYDVKTYFNMLTKHRQKGNIVCLSFITEEIGPTKFNFEFLINLHGPTCELLKIHNSTNVILVCLANLLSLRHLSTRKTRGKSC
jgi:flagellar assembly factor FliW